MAAFNIDWFMLKSRRSFIHSLMHAVVAVVFFPEVQNFLIDHFCSPNVDPDLKKKLPSFPPLYNVETYLNR